MSELENCCGTTCDKVKLAAEITELKAKIAELQSGVLAQSIADLTRKNSELAAQVEQLQAHIELLQAFLMQCKYRNPEIEMPVFMRTGQYLTEIKAQAIRTFVSDTNETGQLSWSDCQWLEDWRDEWLSQQAKAGSNG